jgi:hypothetical protein
MPLMSKKCIQCNISALRRYRPDDHGGMEQQMLQGMKSVSGMEPGITEISLWQQCLY